jgi:endogenous inhibitor of DNA gyrase (YacG/DUF329 family)
MTCPICGRPTDAALRPFCTRRCADIDLAKWMTGSYAIPSDDPEDADQAAEALERGAAERRKQH